MTLKTALTTDLSARGLNLGALADKLGISQQSISKWIARGSIPDSRHAEVVDFLGKESQTAVYLSRQKMAELEVLTAVEVPSFFAVGRCAHVSAPLANNVKAHHRAPCWAVPPSVRGAESDGEEHQPHAAGLR